MERKEIVNKINETLNFELNEYNDEVTVYDGTDAGGEYIKINVFDINVLSIYSFSIAHMTDLEITHIGQMIRSAWMIGRIQFQYGERSGFNEADRIWRKKQ